jgi:hypothetical protein
MSRKISQLISRDSSEDLEALLSKEPDALPKMSKVGPKIDEKFIGCLAFRAQSSTCASLILFHKYASRFFPCRSNPQLFHVPSDTLC